MSKHAQQPAPPPAGSDRALLAIPQATRRHENGHPETRRPALPRVPRGRARPNNLLFLDAPWPLRASGASQAGPHPASRGSAAHLPRGPRPQEEEAGKSLVYWAREVSARIRFPILRFPFSRFLGPEGIG